MKVGKWKVGDKELKAYMDHIQLRISIRDPDPSVEKIQAKENERKRLHEAVAKSAGVSDPESDEFSEFTLALQKYVDDEFGGLEALVE